MKRSTFLLVSLLLSSLLFLGCTPHPPAPTEAPETALYPDPVAFLHGTAPSTFEEDSGFVDQTFVLNGDSTDLGRQYVEALLNGAYDLTLISSHETQKEHALYENYYFSYTGIAEVGSIKMTQTCNIYVGINLYETTDETYIRVLTAKGFSPADNGERAELVAPPTPTTDELE